jgi:uncharacterized protein YjgD (DUF1641 family)
MEQTLTELNQKLDALTAQVQYLADQAQAAERERRDRTELMQDLVPIGNDAFQLMTEQLEEVQEYVDLRDLLRLFKRLLRNGRNFEQMLDQLESFMDLMQTVMPLSDSGFAKAVDLLAEAESKGYFVFARGGLQIMDNVVTSFGEDDVKRLGENIVLMLSLVKDMTQPEILTFVRNTLMIAEQQVQKPIDTSLFALLNQMRDPAVRRGLALTMRILHVVGAQAASDDNAASPN